MSLIVPILSRYIDHITLVSISLFVNGLSNFLIGPCKLLPDSLIIIVVGIFILGGSNATGLIPQIPFMIKHSEMIYPSQSNKITDICTSIFSGLFAVGGFLGPIYGGYVSSIVGYRT